MGVFNNIFGNKKVAKKYSQNWTPLTSLVQLNEIIEKSKEKPQVIFKHSTRCGISRNVLKKFERSTSNNTIDFYYLDLLNFRDISNEIAANFDVIHQSPQLIMLNNQKVVAHDSHYEILNIDLKIT